jgi:hypothetical protein
MSIYSGWYYWKAGRNSKKKTGHPKMWKKSKAKCLRLPNAGEGWKAGIWKNVS